MNRTRSIKLILLTLLATSAVLVAGCAAKDTVDKQGYIKKNNAIQEEAAKAFNGLNVNDPKSVDKAQATLDTAIEKLEKLDPPADYEKPHESMIEALKELSAVLGQAGEAVKAKDPTKLAAITKRMTAAQTKFNTAITAMNKDRT